MIVRPVRIAPWSNVAPTGGSAIPTFEVVVEAIGRAIDMAGVVAIAGGIALVLALAARSTARGEAGIYDRFRHQLGRVILLGLELLVAADIIRTVAVAPTLGSVVVLGAIVLVRTFLIESRPSYDEAATYHLASVGWLRKHPGWMRDSKSDQEPG